MVLIAGDQLDKLHAAPMWKINFDHFTNPVGFATCSELQAVAQTYRYAEGGDMIGEEFIAGFEFTDRFADIFKSLGNGLPVSGGKCNGASGVLLRVPKRHFNQSSVDCIFQQRYAAACFGACCKKVCTEQVL